jgi:hypothetical protein
MNRRIHGALSAAGFALYALVGAAAFAQPAANPGPAAGPARSMSMMGSRTPADQAARLRDLLQLKPAQEAALQAYVTALDGARLGMKGAMTQQPWPQTTPERLDRMQQVMAQHQSALTAIAVATRRFYDQLDPAQKRAFDAMPGGMMGGGMMGGGMGGGWGMGHFGGPVMGPPPPTDDR